MFVIILKDRFVVYMVNSAYPSPLIRYWMYA